MLMSEDFCEDEEIEQKTHNRICHAELCKAEAEAYLSPPQEAETGNPESEPGNGKSSGR